MRILLRCLSAVLIAALIGALACAFIQPQSLNEPNVERVVRQGSDQFGKSVAFTQLRRGSMPIVYVRVQEKYLPFILDTGASHSVVDSRLRSLLGAKQIPSQDESPEYELFDPPRALGDGLTLAHCKSVLCANLGPFSAAFDVECYGILGVDALEPYVIDFDPVSNVITIGRRTLETKQVGDVSRVTRDKYGRPMVVCYVGNAEANCVLDTASLCTLTVSSGVFTSEHDGGRIVQNSEVNVLGFDGKESVVRAGRCIAATFGSTTFHDCVIKEGKDCALGWFALSKGRFTLSISEGKFWYELSDAWKKPDRSDLFGIALASCDKGLLVRSVAPGSVAYECGVIPGDVITRYCGVSVNDLGFVEIRRRVTFMESGLHRFTILRDGKAVNVVMPE